MMKSPLMMAVLALFLGVADAHAKSSMPKSISKPSFKPLPVKPPAPGFSGIDQGHAGSTPMYRIKQATRRR